VRLPIVLMPCVLQRLDAESHLIGHSLWESHFGQ
jgi:hypothetical protein